MSWIWCDGTFREGTLAVSASDRGLCHGLGAFETLLALDGRAVAADLHFSRMRNASLRLGLPRIDEAAIMAAIPELLERNGLGSGRGRLRIAATAGSGALNELAPGGDAMLWMLAAPAPPPPRGITLATSPYARNELSALAGLKAASYAENLIAMSEAKSRGADEALFLNTCGDVCETATANVFAVINGALVTPPLESGCLPGTARTRIIGQAKALAFEVKEEDLRPLDLNRAAGVFVTSATRGVVEVTAIDGRKIPSVPLTAVLKSGFEDECVARRQD